MARDILTGCAGMRFLLAAQIVGIADVYDALTTTRAYRPAMSPEAALTEMTRCKGWWWSEAVFAAGVARAERAQPIRTGLLRP